VAMYRQRPGPLYQQIADELRAQITDGTLPPGAQLPTEMELAERFEVTRQTARQGLAQLIQQGLVVSRRPQGHFVRQWQHMLYRPQAEFMPQPHAPEMDSFMRAMTSEGREPTQKIDVAIVTPPPEVAERLHTPDGEMVVVRRRLRSLAGQPFHLNDSYFPRSIVGGSEIMSPADIGRGANTVLAELGHEQVRALDEIYVRMPTPDEVHRLSLEQGTPVALHIVTGFDSEDLPVRVVLNVLPSDRHVIVFERTRSNSEAE